MWEGDAPCRDYRPFSVRTLAGSDDGRSSSRFVPLYLTSGSIEGDFKTLIQGGAEKCREGCVRNLKRVANRDVLGGLQEDAVLSAMIASGGLPFRVRSV